MKKSILKYDSIKAYEETFINNMLIIAEQNKYINVELLKTEVLDNRNRRTKKKLKLDEVSCEIIFNQYEPSIKVNRQNGFLISTDTSDMCIVYHNGNILHPFKINNEKLINMKLKSL